MLTLPFAVVAPYAAAMNTLVELQDVEVWARGARLLGPLSLTIRQGDFLGVVGPNGAGKTTLLRHMAAIRGRGRSGWLFQRHAFRGDLPFTVADIVGFGRVGHGWRTTMADRQAVEEALTCMEIQSLRGRLYRDLSGGEMQKVQFARLLAQQAELALLDEPTAGLDLDWQERVTQLAALLHQRFARTVVMVTHDVDRLPACCNRVLLLRGGRPLAEGPPAEVLTGDHLSALYGCTVEVVRRNGRTHAFTRGGGET